MIFIVSFRFVSFVFVSEKANLSDFTSPFLSTAERQYQVTEQKSGRGKKKEKEEREERGKVEKEDEN